MSKSLIADFFRRNVVLNIGAPAETPNPNTSVTPTRFESEQIDREIYGMYPQTSSSREFQERVKGGVWNMPYDKPAYLGRSPYDMDNEMFSEYMRGRREMERQEFTTRNIQLNMSKMPEIDKEEWDKLMNEVLGDTIKKNIYTAYGISKKELGDKS